MVLHQNQKKIALDQTRFRILNCGRRFGKTTLAIEEIKGRALFKTARIAYIAPTYQQARDIVWEMLKKELGQIATNINESRLEVKVPNHLGGESHIVLRGWESIESLRGQQFDFLIIDEVASMRNFWIGWQEVLRPTLTDTVGDAMFISTPKGYNHFYTLYNKQDSDSDYKSFRYTSYDNPYLNKEEIDKAKLELPENKFAQEYLADFRKVEGLVYVLQDEAVISPLDKDIKTEKRIMGIDWGFRNPAAIWIGYLRDKVWYTVEDWKMGSRTTAEIIQVVNNKIKEHLITQVYPDPAEPDRIEECRRAGIPVYNACKDIEGGISYIQGLIRENRFKVGNNCTNFLEEINTYQYPEGVDGKPDKEVPEKMNDHLMDAMRYAIYSSDGKPLRFNQASPLTYGETTINNNPSAVV
jgi:PBSX family phage terminase large subunit